MEEKKRAENKREDVKEGNRYGGNDETNDDNSCVSCICKCNWSYMIEVYVFIVSKRNKNLRGRGQNIKEKRRKWRSKIVTVYMTFQ